MDFKQVFNFKKRVAELISLFKNISTFDFLGRLKALTKDLYGLIALAGGTLMFIGAFIPNYWAGFWGINEYANLFQAPWGWFVFVLTLGILGFGYFKQYFWAGLTSALCLTISVIQAIVYPLSIKIQSGGWIEAGVHVGWFFLLFGELAVIGAFALNSFGFLKSTPKASPTAPACEAPAEAVEATPVAEAAPVAEEASTQPEQ